MARLQIPKTSPTVGEICREAGIKLKKFGPPAEFLREAVTYIEKNDIVHLATSKADVPRCTPLGYKNVGTTLYILCEGGGKFANLKTNPRVCYSIASRVKGRRGLTSVQGLQCWGDAEVISMRENPEAFGKLISLWSIGEQFKKKGPQALPPFHYRIIKIVPHRMRMLNLPEGINNVTWTRR
jgi:hypothetical protein